ncbi:MAG: Gfo/Idh/MocA family oxidoreductase [Bacteroidetes bacterium]|nr:Gfo/Idh/MocA family oxidoreductase [Bacteroidota bacterium]
MKKINIGLIGCGYWGQNFARIIDNSANCKLFAIADSDAKRIEQIRQQYPHVKTVTDTNELLNSKEIEAVVVATPVSTHFKIVKQALENDKHVLCEKVLSDKIEEIKILQELSRKKELTLLVGFTFLFNSVVRHIKRAIENDELGKMQYLTFKRTGHGLVRHDVDVVNDLASHDISILLYWMGMPEWVSCTTRAILGKGHADMAFMQMGYANGMIASVHVSWVSPLKQRIIEITGDKCMMIFDDVQSSEKLRIIKSDRKYQSLSSDFGSFQLAVKSGDILIPNVNYPEPLINELGIFTKCIRKKEKLPNEFDLSEKIWQIVDCAYKSNAQLGKQISVNIT